MRIENHISKASRIVASLAKCGPDDYEAFIEASMLAATHWFNIVLHVTAIRATGDDAMHGTKLTVEEHIRCQELMPEIVEAIEVIEGLRSPFVRGAEDGGVEAGRLAFRQLGLIEARSRQLMSG